MKRTQTTRSPLHWWHPVLGLLVGGGLGWLVKIQQWDIAVSILAILALIAFGAFGLDKSQAQRGIRRIAEATLLFWTALGGTVGALLAISALRHKTQKPAFLRPLWLIIACQIIGFVAILLIFKQVK